MLDRKIVLDVETTGLYPSQGHKVIEVAAIELFNDKDCGDYIHYYINPKREIPQEASNIHGIFDEDVQNCPVFEDIADELLGFIKDSKVIAHNAEFDRGFINHELSLIGKNTYDKSSFIDSLVIAKQKVSGSRASLDYLCKEFNISLESRKDYHGALIDVKLLAEVYYCLVKGQKDIFENSLENNAGFSNRSNNHYDGDFGKHINKVTNFPLRNFKLSEEEEAIHLVFLDKIKNNVWKLNK